jgi:hypothetical protein
MFEMFYWSSIISALEKLPKEAIISVAGAYAAAEIYKRHTNARIRLAQIEADAQVKIAEAESETLRLKIKLQEITDTATR